MKRARTTTQFVDEGPNEVLPGQRFGLEVELPAILDQHSSFQHLQIFQSVSYGKILVLDGVVQLTERDEFAYHEMIAHVPIVSLLGKQLTQLKVLLVGAGDGGALREILKHPEVVKITHIEIDQLVVDACRQHLPNISNGAFADPRVNLVICDGLEYLRQSAGKDQGEYDLCIVDSGDPSEGPNGALYQAEFYSLVKRWLNPKHGLLCFQSEHVWLHHELIVTLKQRCDTIFPLVRYYSTQVPSYPGGQIGFLLCALDDQCRFKQVLVHLSPTLELKYYTPQVHSASFALPKWFQTALLPQDGKRKE
ncbi:spermidine synthase [Batrachochytrium salamandrivorans]|nr:spermidine synthase [Batrachochytrium salamandrivorans]